MAYFQEYNFTNMGGGGDWIEALNTNIDASKYVVTIISAYYNKALEMSDANNFAIPYVSAYIDAVENTWFITADYASAAPASGTPVGQWIISTLILSRDFSKSFGVQTVNSAGTRGGAASTPIID